MPHKFNADHRDRIPKQKQRVTNWPEYNESLRQRGDLTVWISEDALAACFLTQSRNVSGLHPVFSEIEATAFDQEG